MPTQFVYRLKCAKGCEDCDINVFTPLLMRVSTLPIRPSFQGHDLVQVFQEQPSHRAAMRGTAVTVACFTGKMVSFEPYDAQETINTRSRRARKQPVSFKEKTGRPDGPNASRWYGRLGRLVCRSRRYRCSIVYIRQGNLSMSQCGTFLIRLLPPRDICG